MHAIVRFLLAAAALASATAAAQPFDSGNIKRMKFSGGGGYLVVEVLRDDLLHFEISAATPVVPPEKGIYTTPVVVRGTTHPGPTSYSASGNVLETAALKVEVTTNNLCVTVYDKKAKVYLTTVCPKNLDKSWKGLTIDKKGMRNAYGLGNYFADAKTADGDWVGRIWQEEPQGHGNFRRAFHGAAPSTAQLPILYVLGPGTQNYALFLDHAYRMRWDFTAAWWSFETWGDQLRFYVIAGPNLAHLRTTYLGLVGKPLVPPRRSFGFFQSKFGYQNWNDLYGELRHLRENRFPVDGFALDIQWFGKDFGGDPAKSPMGSLSFEPNRFPSPKDAVAHLRDVEGVALMPIEESVISTGVPVHKELAQLGHLVRAGCATCAPSHLAGNPWWGVGGYLDWTSTAAGDWWHDQKRQKLVEMGITSHWTDLGEPEVQLYDPNGYYQGWPEIQKFGHGDVHNLYAFKWLESIARGYTRNSVAARPFMLSRAGAPGIWRFGAAMWSGDIARNLGSLKAQLNTQLHMSLAGLDYYGSDAGGFTTPDSGMDQGDPAELYTQWFAASAMGDTPLRPHGWAAGTSQSFAPDLNGHADSNRANLRLRYELSAYVYSLAHRAYRFAEPVFPPVVFHFQEDANVRGQANVKMIGPSLLYAVVAGYGETERKVYLPRGRWVSWHSNEWVQSSGAYTAEVPVYRDGLLRLPLFARAGAIIPKMYVDDKTMNVSGKRRDEAPRTDLVARVFADATASTFTLYEDDGESVAYQKGAVRETVLKQQLQAGGTSATVRVGAATGTYTGAPSSRDNVIELVVENQTATGVTVNGSALPACTDAAEFATGKVCFVQAETNLVRARSGARPVSEAKEFVFKLSAVAQPTTSLHFVCRDAPTSSGENIYVLGSVPQLGAWQAAKAVKLVAVRYPRWSRVVAGLPANTRIEWKCLRLADGASAGTLAPGGNVAVTTPAAGFGGTTWGSMK